MSSQVIVEFARAKINLTLRVLGRRDDGYHELESLVVFADIGDRLTFDPSAPQHGTNGWSLRTIGPFAEAIAGENLAELALRRLEVLGVLSGLAGQFLLEKHLPVAAGIGGGSADAAAVLRVVRKISRAALPERDWFDLAARLGADVPVCFVDRSAMMRGTGERIERLNCPGLAVVIANPLTAVPADKTRRVFAGLGLAPGNMKAASATPELACLRDVLDYVRTAGNDLDTAATTVLPVISSVRIALSACQGCEHVFLSGAGPTCVGLFAGPHAANDAAMQIAAEYPKWWVRAAIAGG